MRFLQRSGLALAILAVLFANANVLAERIAEDMVADGVSKGFDLSRRPDVDLTGFPILVKALKGELPDVGFTARTFVTGDLQVEHLSVRLTGLRGKGSLFSGPYSITVASGVAQIVVNTAGVNAWLASRDEDATVVINEGRARVTTHIQFRGRRTISAAARVALDGDRVTITPVSGSFLLDGEPAPPVVEQRARRDATFAVDLPSLPGGLRATSLELVPGEVHITAKLSDRTFEVRG